MSEPRVKATARVTVTIEVDVRSTWGGDCSVAQVQQQAAREAIDMLEKAARVEVIADVARHVTPRFRVVGRPSVEAVLVKESSR